MTDEGDIWAERYGHVCPGHAGNIIPIEGVGGRDTYSPAVYEVPGSRVLAFRCEGRESDVHNRLTYHPTVWFANQSDVHTWYASGAIPPFDMLEDPFFFHLYEKGRHLVVMGGVRLQFDEAGGYVTNTELYKGETLGSLNREPFLVVAGMKGVRFRQMPDGRYLLCRRPEGGEYGEGRITIHIIEHLEDVNNSILMSAPLAVLGSQKSATDWVGVNSLYFIQDPHGEAWAGLLGYVAFRDAAGQAHYAAATYKLKLQDLLDRNVHAMEPHIIATRRCFDAGPAKRPDLTDIVIPGHLEQIDAGNYRLWAGLSDARIGCLEVNNPFAL